MKKHVFRVTPSGKVEGLWADTLAGVGEASVTRASEVEFNDQAKGWTVQLLVGPYKGAFLPRTYPRRNDALAAEVVELNRQIAEGRL